ncbi:hypothetical protein SEA_WHOSEMANZ_4 [Gordonia phage WhoseManz]|nr:hypothetical protein SEA_WHOSEMANZ_4 [Gordonia phage WhoseManz]
MNAENTPTPTPTPTPPLPPNVEVGNLMRELAEQMREKLAPALRELGLAARGMFQTIEAEWPTVQRIAEEAQREVDERNPPDPNSLRDERGVKRPASVPPMWANSPARQRRRR